MSCVITRDDIGEVIADLASLSRNELRLLCAFRHRLNRGDVIRDVPERLERFLVLTLKEIQPELLARVE